jgi:hypothetical protein
MNDLRVPRRMPDDRVDEMLRTFFRAEMPDPWPVLEAPELPPQTLVLRPWWKRTGRFALAASVLLMLLGYLALASGFPRSSGTGSGGLERQNGEIGNLRTLDPKRPVGKNLIHMQTPDGKPVLIEESKGSDGRLFFKARYTREPQEKR